MISREFDFRIYKSKLNGTSLKNDHGVLILQHHKTAVTRPGTSSD
jgi:hypothetical protein